MFGLQPTHLIIIALVAILFFAPSRIPMLIGGMRKMISEFRKETRAESSSDKHTPPAP